MRYPPPFSPIGIQLLASFPNGATEEPWNCTCLIVLKSNWLKTQLTAVSAAHSASKQGEYKWTQAAVHSKSVQ